MRFPLSARIFFTQMFLLVFAIGLVALAACLSLEHLQSETTRDNLRLVSTAMARESGERLELYRNSLEELGRQLAKAADPRKYPEILARDSQPEFWRFFSTLSVTDKDGNQLVHLPPSELPVIESHAPPALPGPGTQQLVEMALVGERAVVSDTPIVRPDHDGYALDFALAVKNNREPQALLLAQAPLAGFFAALPDSLLPKNGYALLVNAQGLVLASSRSELVMQPFVWTGPSRTGTTGYVGQTVINGATSLVTATPVSGTSWQALAVMPVAGRWQSSLAFREFVSLFAPGILLFVGFIALLTAWLLSRPLRRLANACATPKEIAALEPEQKIFRRQDEVGELARTMLTMARELQDTRSRTADLAATQAVSMEENAVAEQRRQEFLARLRAELHFQATALEELAAEPTRENDRKNLKRTVRNLRKLSANLFDLYDFDGGSITIKPAPFSLHGFAEKIAMKMRMPAMEKGLDFVYENDGAVPTTVSGDEARIWQILETLLTVIIALARNGAVALRVRPLGLKGENGHAAIRFHLEVSCSPGALSEDEQKALLAALANDEQFRPEKTDGLWLDLSPARHLLLLMNGSAGVRQTAEGGVIFFLEFTLPIVTAEEKQNKTANRQGG